MALRLGHVRRVEGHLSPRTDPDAPGREFAHQWAELTTRQRGIIHWEPPGEARSGGEPGEGQGGPDRPGEEQPADHAAPEDEEPEQGAREYRDLPEMRECEAEGDG
jgi:hypothetical protein